jgi:hypothetical protein
MHKNQMRPLRFEMLTSKILSDKWRVTTSFSNNKTDQCVITAIDLVKFINKQRRKEIRRKKAINDKSAVKPVHPMSVWLIDLAYIKCEEYIEQYKMKDAEILNINIQNMT